MQQKIQKNLNISKNIQINHNSVTLISRGILKMPEGNKDEILTIDQ